MRVKNHKKKNTSNGKFQLWRSRLFTGSLIGISLISWNSCATGLRGTDPVEIIENDDNDNSGNSKEDGNNEGYNDTEPRLLGEIMIKPEDIDPPDKL